MATSNPRNVHIFFFQHSVNEDGSVIHISSNLNPSSAAGTGWISIREISTGGSSSIRLEEDSTGNVRVVKQIRGAKHTDLIQAARLHAMELISKRHDLFVALHGWYTTPDTLFIMHQNMEHGDLEELIHLEDITSSANDIARQVSDGVATLHNGRTNISLSSPAPVRILLANYRALRSLDSVTPGPSPAPERFGTVTITGNETIDMWAIGSLLYEISTASFLFQMSAEDDAASEMELGFTLLDLLCVNKVSLPTESLQLRWDTIRDGSIVFLENLLAANPDCNPSATTALLSTWFTADGSVSGERPMPSTVTGGTRPSSPDANSVKLEELEESPSEDVAAPPVPDGDVNRATIKDEPSSQTAADDDSTNMGDAPSESLPTPCAPVDHLPLPLPVTVAENSTRQTVPYQQPIDADVRANDDGPDLPDDLLHVAGLGDVEAAQSLLARGATIDDADIKGVTPLLRAAARGQTDMVRFLLTAGANIGERDHDGDTALLLAAWYGHTSTITFLFQSGSTIDERDYKDATALLLAAYNGHCEAVRLLLANGASLTEVDHSGSTAALKAAFNGHTNTLETLQAHGAELRQKNKRGDAAISLAAYGGHVDSVRFLLDQGVDIDSESVDGYTPLLNAAAQGHAEVAKLLLSRGADAEKEVEEGDVISVAEGNEHFATADEIRAHIVLLKSQRTRTRRGQRGSVRHGAS